MDDYTDDDIERMKLVELKAKLKARGARTTGKEFQLVANSVFHIFIRLPYVICGIRRF